MGKSAGAILIIIPIIHIIVSMYEHGVNPGTIVAFVILLIVFFIIINSNNKRITKQKKEEEKEERKILAHKELKQMLEEHKENISEIDEKTNNLMKKTYKEDFSKCKIVKIEGEVQFEYDRHGRWYIGNLELVIPEN